MLITPDIIESQCIDVLKRRHTEHLAAFERDREMAPRTLEPLATVDLLVGSGFRLRDDKPPACLLGLFGTDRSPQREKDGTLTFDWTLAAQVAVVGTSRADTVKRRGWYAMIVAECLLSRLPRDADPVDALELLDVDFTNATTREAAPRVVGEAQLLFSVRVRKSLDMTVLPPDDTTRPPGEPGGPPGDPYEPPVGWPELAEGYPHSTTTKENL